MAGGMVVVACVLVVLTLFDAMSSVRSTETPDQLRGVLRGLVLASGALAAAGAVLGVYALRRHRGARLGLTVTAGLLLFSSLALADPLPVVVAVGAGMLWSQEARDWFDGRSRREPVERSAVPPAPPAPPEPPAAPDAVPPADPYAGPSAGPSTGLSTGHYPGSYAPSHAWPGPATPQRPSGVTVAAWLTWVFCGLTALVFVVVVAEILGARDQLLSSLHRNPALPPSWDDRHILAGLWVASAVGIFWSLAAIALAVLAFRRVQLGRIGLVVSALVSAVVAGVTLVGLLNAAAAVTVVVLLFSGRANAWYAGRPFPAHDQPPPRPPVW
jgi:hypothetical protein